MPDTKYLLKYEKLRTGEEKLKEELKEKEGRK